jgi:methyl-accepting chemotaxis protein
MIASLKNMKLSVKIPLIMLLLAGANAGFLGTIAVTEAKNSAIELTKQKLEAIRGDMLQSVSNYFDNIRDDLIINSESQMVREALREFTSGYDNLAGVDQAQYLQTKYIDENPNKVGEKELLDYASDGTNYSTSHASYHPLFRNILKRHEYYDIFLINTQGNIIYTVYKERDFATNVMTGKWKDTAIGNLFRSIKADPKRDKTYFEDFKSYEPSNNIPAAFLGAPILAPKTNEFLGVIAYQMPIARINALTQVSEDVSKTLEVHLVGKDRFLRNDPNVDDKEDPILKEKLDMSLVDSAIDGKSGVEWAIDGNTKTLDAYMPFDAFGTKWALVIDIFEDEALEGVRNAQKMILMAALGVLAVVALISFFYSRTITAPIKSLMATMKTLADRDYTNDVPYRMRGDELGDMARSVEVFKENGLAVQKLETEQAGQKLQAEQEKKEAMHALANDFDARTSGVIKSLAAAAAEMQATAAQMKAASANTTRSSQIVATAAAEADSNVQTVAAATEELSASSSEIARQIASVAEKSSRASQEAVQTSEQVSELNTMADAIGEVISAIKGIAEQTNLLALNATIEAARAGEAGKGFAVVADEVKKLATETANKTIQIDERVGKIQAAVRGTVEAVGRIITDVQNIDHSTSTVASAVEEQNAATAEIGRNVSEASTGTQQVAENIVDVQRNAEETGEAANNLDRAANDLADIAENLQTQVSGFLDEIRGS